PTTWSFPEAREVLQLTTSHVMLSADNDVARHVPGLEGGGSLMVYVTRRALLYGSAAVAAGGALSGCSFFSTQPDSDGPGPAGGDGALEAPSLKEKVEAGELPELSARLPKEPMVVEPLNELGRYGGAWRTYAMGPDDTNAYNPIGYEGLVRWIPEYTGATGTDEILPNLAEYEANEDGTVYTFRLREGV